jgi:hypothetical protein
MSASSTTSSYPRLCDEEGSAPAFLNLDSIRDLSADSNSKLTAFGLNIDLTCAEHMYEEGNCSDQDHVAAAELRSESESAATAGDIEWGSKSQTFKYLNEHQWVRFLGKTWCPRM